MIRGFASPSRYFQGEGVVDQIGRQIKPLGKRFLLLADDVVLGIAGERVKDSLRTENLELVTEIFRGECCEKEISRLSARASEDRVDAVIGMGGGKAVDTAKMINFKTGLPVVVVPTVASNDASTSQLAVVYDDNHVKAGVFFMDRGSDLILVDTGIISRSPIRTFRAGIGDAISTSFEAEACHISKANNIFGVKPATAALSLARLSLDILKRHALDAIRAVEAQKVTEDLDLVVEATILLSGLGFESGGLAAAHSIHGGFTAIPAMQKSLHGELVAFGVLAQCVLENRDDLFMKEMVDFYNAIGLPMTLADLGLTSNRDESLSVVAGKVCVPGSYIYNMPVPIDEEKVIQSILAADELGTAAKAMYTGG